MALEEKSRKRGVAVEIRRLESAWQLTLVAPTGPACSPPSPARSPASA